jgi:hypothetical protein
MVKLKIAKVGIKQNNLPSGRSGATPSAFREKALGGLLQLPFPITLLKFLMRDDIFPHHIKKYVNSSWPHEFEIFANCVQGVIEAAVRAQILLEGTIFFIQCEHLASISLKFATLWTSKPWKASRVPGHLFSITFQDIPD